MRIYEIVIEHKKFGSNWSSVKVIANTADEAVRKAKKNFVINERIQCIKLLASTN
jgi:hypothetical protein